MSTHLQQDEQPQKSAVERWLEPLYDLVVGLVIGQLTGVFTDVITPASFIRFCWLFVPAWWIWNGFSAYFDRFDRNSRFQQVILLLSMIPVLLFSVTAPQTFQAKIPGFTWSYVAARALLLVLLMYSWRTDQDNRAAAVGLLRGYTLGLLCWIVGGIWTDYGIAWKLTGLAIDFTTPWLNRRRLAPNGLSKQHFAKRLQSFTLIVVGQNVNVQPKELRMMLWNFSALTTAVSGFMLAVGVWWWYYQHYEKIVTNARQSTDLRYTFGHLFLFLGTGTLSLGVFSTLTKSHTSWLLPLGLTLYAGALVWMSYPLILARCRPRYVAYTMGLVITAWAVAWLPVLDWVRLLLIDAVVACYFFITQPTLMPLAPSASK